MWITRPLVYPPHIFEENWGDDAPGRLLLPLNSQSLGGNKRGALASRECQQRQRERGSANLAFMSAERTLEGGFFPRPALLFAKLVAAEGVSGGENQKAFPTHSCQPARTIILCRTSIQTHHTPLQHLPIRNLHSAWGIV